MIIRQFNFFHIFTKEETFDRNIIGLMYYVSFNFSNRNYFPHERKSNLCRYQTDSGFLVATTNQQLNSLTSVTAPVSHSVYLCPRKALNQILLFATLNLSGFIYVSIQYLIDRSRIPTDLTRHILPHKSEDDVT